MIENYETEIFSLKEIVNLSKDLKVLYVEDDEQVKTQTLKLLGNFFIDIDSSSDGEKGLRRYKKLYDTGSPYDIVITDIKMPSLNGVDMSKTILTENNEQYIIVTTAYSNIDDMQKLINMGVTSYIKKPIDTESIVNGLTKILNLKSTKNKLLTKLNEIDKLQDENEYLKQLSSKLKEQANTDSMTGLYNRRYFTEVSKQLISLSKRTSENLGLIVLDIDRFKLINDTYGHGFGDEVIKHFANIVSGYIRQSDIAARIGGEEFAVFLPNTNRDGIIKIGEKLRHIIEQEVLYIDSKEFRYTVSIGGDVVWEDDDTIEQTIKRADHALYEAKRSGRNKMVLYSDS